MAILPLSCPRKIKKYEQIFNNVNVQFEWTIKNQGIFKKIFRRPPPEKEFCENFGTEFKENKHHFIILFSKVTVKDSTIEFATSSSIKILENYTETNDQENTNDLVFIKSENKKEQIESSNKPKTSTLGATTNDPQENNKEHTELPRSSLPDKITIIGKKAEWKAFTENQKVSN